MDDAPEPLQNMNIGAVSAQSAVIMISLPGLLSLLVEVGHTVLHEGEHEPLRQVLAGLQLIVVPLSDVRVMDNFDGLIPAALLVMTWMIC